MIHFLLIYIYICNDSFSMCLAWKESVGKKYERKKYMINIIDLTLKQEKTNIEKIEMFLY